MLLYVTFLCTGEMVEVFICGNDADNDNKLLVLLPMDDGVSMGAIVYFVVTYTVAKTV